MTWTTSLHLMSAADDTGRWPRFAHGTRLVQALDYARSRSAAARDRWMDAVESIDGPDPFRCELIPREELGYAFNARSAGSRFRDPRPPAPCSSSRRGTTGATPAEASVTHGPERRRGSSTSADGHVAQSWRTPNSIPPRRARCGRSGRRPAASRAEAGGLRAAGPASGGSSARRARAVVCPCHRSSRCWRSWLRMT